jgi:3-dehydroquinate synthase
MSDPYVQRFSIAHEYPVYFTRDVFDPANRDFVAAVCRVEPARRHRLLFLIDRGVADAWPTLCPQISRYAEQYSDRIDLAAAPVVIEGGEASKNDPVLVDDLHARMHSLALDRQSFAVLIGGGAMLDMAGYAAATTHRGVRAVRVPTTVLAQADSGVGVKNGVNAFGKKNFIGTFAPPFAVLIDGRFLQTLGRRDTLAGMAEAVKVAVIRDRAFFGWIQDHAPALARCEPDRVDQLVRRCAELHLDHIATSGDPFELGSARPLDFGHWAAHKLEALTSHRLRHGEAVSIGMAIDTIYSAESGLCNRQTEAAMLETLRALGLPLWDDALALRAPSGKLRVLEGLAEFREHLGGELCVTMLSTIGQRLEVSSLDEARIAAAIGRLREAACA